MTQREKDLGWCEEGQTYCSLAEENYKIRQQTLEEVKRRFEPYASVWIAYNVDNEISKDKFAEYVVKEAKRCVLEIVDSMIKENGSSTGGENEEGKG